MSWRIAVDTGGTFTDCVAVAPDGSRLRAKVLSSSTLRGTARPIADRRVRLTIDEGPSVRDFFRGGLLGVAGEASQHRIVASDGTELTLATSWAHVEERAAEVRFAEPAPILAARWVTATAGGDRLPPVELRLATTRATNALLERRGAPVAFFVTRGFADLLRIGTQQRPDLFAVRVERAAPLHHVVVEVSERLAADGSVLEPVDRESVRCGAERARAAGAEVAAVALLHAYRNPEHEVAVAEALTAAGFEAVSLSSRLARRPKLVSRAETAVANAYLTPVLDRYVREVAAAVGEANLRLMTSSGGLRAARDYEPRDSLLSGPAGGVVGAADAAAEMGPLLAFDMGGTSTDVSRIGGTLEYSEETTVAGVRVLAPSLPIETVAAGGGSICSFDGHQMKVGPESAGADPGPACYGAGGPLTLTDVNLLLGRLDPAKFPFPLSELAARERADELVTAAATASGEELDWRTALSGLLEIADERMAEAIRRVSLRRGVSPREHALVAFGGAGAQHACSVASRLGIERILVPYEAGVLSASGLAAAREEAMGERAVLETLADVGERLGGLLKGAGRAAAEQLGKEDHEEGDLELRQLVELRLLGQESALVIEGGEGWRPSEWEAAFRAAYRERYGYDSGDEAVEVVAIRVVASLPGWQADPFDLVGDREPEGGEAAPRRRAWVGATGIDGDTSTREELATETAGDGWREVRSMQWDSLGTGWSGQGPLFVDGRHSTVFVASGWSCSRRPRGDLLLERRSST